MTENQRFAEKQIFDAIKQAVATKKRIRLLDPKTRGLLVDVTKTGAASFYVRRRVNTILRWERLGEFGDRVGQLTIKQARDEADKVRSLMGEGKSPQQVKRALKGEPTLRDTFDEYIEQYAKEHSKTWQVMVKDFDRNLQPLASIRISQITRADVQSLKEQLAVERGKFTANRTMQLLRAIFNKAIRWELFEGRNPAAGIELYKEQPRNRFLAAEEVQDFLLAVQGIKPGRVPPEEWEPVNKDTRDLIMLSMLTGARKSNIMRMRFSQIDAHNGTWMIPEAESKNGQCQVIALTGIELALLHERKASLEKDPRWSESDFVFPGRGKTGHLQDIKRAWTTLRKQAGIPDVTIHDLRRNLGSWMASENVNVALIKGALNHKDMKTTLAVYARTAKDAERDGRLQAHIAMFDAAGDAGKRLLKIAQADIDSDTATPSQKARNARRQR